MTTLHFRDTVRAFLTLALSLMLGLTVVSTAAGPAHAAGEAVRADDQTFSFIGDQSLGNYLQHSGGTDSDVVRWSSTDAPAWVELKPNGLMTGVTPFTGGTFTFTVTATSGTLSGTPVSQDTAVVTIVVTPLPMEIGPAVGADGNKYVLLGKKTFTEFTLNQATGGKWTSTPPPPGLTMSPEGVLTGRMTQAGTFPMTVTALWRGEVAASKTYNFVGTSAMAIVTNGYGNKPRVAVGRPFTIPIRIVSSIGRTTLKVPGKLPKGWKLRRLSATTYSLAGELKSRKKVRIPVILGDESGSRKPQTLVVTPFPT